METAVFSEKCRSIIRAGPIAQDRIKEALNGSNALLHAWKGENRIQNENCVKSGRQNIIRTRTRQSISFFAPMRNVDSRRNDVVRLADQMTQLGWRRGRAGGRGGGQPATSGDAGESLAGQRRAPTSHVH